MGNIVSLSPEFEVQVNIGSNPAIIGVSDLVTSVDCISYLMRALSMSEDEKKNSVREDDVVAESFVIAYRFYGIRFLPLGGTYCERLSSFTGDVRSVHMSASLLQMFRFGLLDGAVIESEDFQN